MLAALEDLLDAWPGTLLVVSHDRYLMERITDQQFAVVDRGLRHLPGGVDEYVRLSRERRAGGGGIGTFGTASGVATPTGGGDDAGAGSSPSLTGAERREVEKELKAVERRMAKVTELTEGTHHAMVMHDQSDFAGLARFMKDLKELEAEQVELEERWLDLSERLG
jgi:hypothetical protein